MRSIPKSRLISFYDHSNAPLPPGGGSVERGAYDRTLPGDVDEVAYDSEGDKTPIDYTGKIVVPCGPRHAGIRSVRRPLYGFEAQFHQHAQSHRPHGKGFGRRLGRHANRFLPDVDAGTARTGRHCVRRERTSPPFGWSGRCRSCRATCHRTSTCSCRCTLPRRRCTSLRMRRSCAPPIVASRSAASCSRRSSG